MRTTPQLLNQGLIWVNNRRSFIKTREASGVSSLLMLPVFAFEFLLIALIMGLLVFSLSLYVIFRLLASLPKLRKGGFR